MNEGYNRFMRIQFMALLHVVALTVAVLTPSGAPAQISATAYPEKPIRLVVPFAAGGALDVVGRILGQKLTESWGRQILIDNRLGAAGNIGAEFDEGNTRRLHLADVVGDDASDQHDVAVTSAV